MDPDTLISPVTSDSSTSPSRRSLLSLLGVGPIAGGLASLATPAQTEARKKRKKKKKKNKGGKGGGNQCAGRVNGSASTIEHGVLLQKINDFRQQNGGLPPLARQSQLDSAAVAHSRDMATRCFFDHINPNGADPGDRIAATGYQASAWAENIYKGSGALGSAVEAFNAWESSTQGHRENMLSTTVTEIGIGTALDSAGFMIWTNVFGKPAT
jgi:uncharacterized protein YkwD